MKYYKNLDFCSEDDNDSIKMFKDLGQNESFSTNFILPEGSFQCGNNFKNNESNANEIKNIDKNNFFNENTIFSSKRSFENTNLIIDKNNNFQININSKKVNHSYSKKVDAIINNNTKSKNEKKVKGRKKIDSNEFGKHDRNTDDNMTRKCKHIVLDNIFKSINATIKKVYNNNTGDCNEIRQLKKINQGQILKSKADYNKEFLYKRMSEIFSSNISTKYSRHSLEYNKNLINQLLNEGDEKKRVIFEKIFNLTFLDCLKCFRCETIIQELEGFRKLDEVCLSFKDDENYMNKFKEFINNYEEKIMSKKLRNRAKKNN